MIGLVNPPKRQCARTTATSDHAPYLECQQGIILGEVYRYNDEDKSDWPALKPRGIEIECQA